MVLEPKALKREILKKKKVEEIKIEVENESLRVGDKENDVEWMDCTGILGVQKRNVTRGWRDKKYRLRTDFWGLEIRKDVGWMNCNGISNVKNRNITRG